MDNRVIAQRLLAEARTLEGQHANLYRIKAYRRAAQTILGLDRPVEDLLVDAGRKVLKELPGIGISLSQKIETLVRTGDLTKVKEDDHRMVAV